MDFSFSAEDEAFLEVLRGWHACQLPSFLEVNPTSDTRTLDPMVEHVIRNRVATPPATG